MCRLPLALLLLLAAASPAAAQEIADSHLAAAEALLVAAETEAVMNQGIDSMLESQIEINPEMEAFDDIMRAFAREHLSWEAIRDEMVRIYAQAFTEDELREITAFYQTETGRKAVLLTPRLMAQGMEVGQRAFLANRAELEARIEERMRKLNR